MKIKSASYLMQTSFGADFIYPIIALGFTGEDAEKALGLLYDYYEISHTMERPAILETIEMIEGRPVTEKEGYVRYHHLFE